MTDYATLAEFKTYLRAPADASADDTLMEMALSSASRAIDQATGRQFGSLTPAEARYYYVYREGSDYYVDIEDLFDITGLTVCCSSGVETWDTELEYSRLPWNAA